MAKAEHRVQLKRAYEDASPEDGTRVLVERLWPRGVAKERARIDLWLKDVAPSAGLRTWYGHDPAKFDEFRRRYEDELAREPAATALAELRDLARRGPLTLVCATRDVEHSGAAVLLEALRH